MNTRRAHRVGAMPRSPRPRQRAKRAEPSPTLRLDEAAGPHPAVLRLCELIRKIPLGRVRTYGQLAADIGWPRHARFVGRFLAESPLADSLPWHRVIGSGGMIRERSGGGTDQQRTRLISEDVPVSLSGRVDIDRYGWSPIVPT